MFRRHLSRELEAAASDMPVVTLTGPRQSGKTTLVKHVFPEHAYVSLELPDERTLALEDSTFPRVEVGTFCRLKMLNVLRHDRQFPFEGCRSQEPVQDRDPSANFLRDSR